MLISDLNHLRQINQIRFREEVVKNHKVTIVSYMISTPDLWLIPQATEARGITFNENGDCICRPFEKFFNVNENPQTQENLISTNFHNATVFPKIDGSMITPVLFDNEIRLKTKKSFFSEVALLAQDHFTPELNELSLHFLRQNFTPIFEFTHPNNRVVIRYRYNKHFTLIALRHQITGEYRSLDDIPDGTTYDVSRPVQFESFDDMKLCHECFENLEGWVIQFPNQRVKLKTKWYIDRHYNATELSVRNVAEIVINEALDDLIPEIDDPEMLATIRRIEFDVTSRMSEIMDNVRIFNSWTSHMSDKDVWMYMERLGQGVFKYPSLLMQFRKKGEVDIKSYFSKNLLKKYTTRKVSDITGHDQLLSD